MAFEFLVLLFATLDSIHLSSVSLRALNSSGSAREYHISASQTPTRFRGCVGLILKSGLFLQQRFL